MAQPALLTESGQAARVAWPFFIFPSIRELDKSSTMLFLACLPMLTGNALRSASAVCQSGMLPRIMDNHDLLYLNSAHWVIKSPVIPNLMII